MQTKSQVAISLSKLLPFTKPKPHLEQYSTDAEIAASFLWQASLLKDIVGKNIVDFGAGTGVLGIGCLLLDAKEVFFVEKDRDVIPLLMENLDGFDNYEVLMEDVKDFTTKVDTVVMNPPFGVQQRKADKVFVEKAFEVGKVVYYVGKVESKTFIEAITKDHKKEITHFWQYELPLKKTMQHHTKKKKVIAIGCWRIQ
tara:strand:- start:8 stop:601 length:594 start_codon:yes stop_codon:yes gene_type:complete